MKRLLLLTCLVNITSASFSQINKGQWLIGGNTSFSSNQKELIVDQAVSKIKATTFQISPNAGFFITDKLAAGARISFTKSKNEVVTSDYSENSNTLSLSPFIRYYFLPKKERLNLFADAGYTYGRFKTSTEFPRTNFFTSSKGATNGYYISAGPAIFLTPTTALELTVSYNYSKTKDYNLKDKDLRIGVGFQIHLGK